MSTKPTGVLFVKPCARCRGMNMLWRKYGPRNVGYASGIVARKKRSPRDPTKTMCEELSQKIKDSMIIPCPECGAKLTGSMAATVFFLPEVTVLLQQRFDKRG